jgi:hypothetical protein
MVDVDHPAIAAAPARRRHFAVGGGTHGVASLAVQIEPGMHGRRTRERVHAHAETGRRLDVAVDRLAHGNAADGTRQPHDLRARGFDAMKLALEAERVLCHRRGEKRAAHGPSGVGDCRLAEVEAELREHAADAARLGIVILRQRIDRRVLPLLHPVEGCLQAGDRSGDAAPALGKHAGARIDRHSPIERNQEGALVIEQGRLERKRPRLANGTRW